MYAGFSVAIVRPQVTAPGHRGSLMRLPLTSFTALRKSAGGFSRASLGWSRKVRGQGNPAFGPTQSGSAAVALSRTFGKIVAAVEVPVLSIKPLGKVLEP